MAADGLGPEDTELITLSGSILRGSGYEVSDLEVDGIDAILARSASRVAIVSAFFSNQALVQFEPGLAKALADTVSLPENRAQRWDGYLVLLSSQPPQDADLKAIYDLTYNLRQVRRIVKSGVTASASDIATALRPLLPLADASSGAGGIGANPLDELERRLQATNLDENVISNAFASFRAEMARPLSLTTTSSEFVDSIDAPDEASAEVETDPPPVKKPRSALPKKTAAEGEASV